VESEVGAFAQKTIEFTSGVHRLLVVIGCQAEILFKAQSLEALR